MAKEGFLAARTQGLLGPTTPTAAVRYGPAEESLVLALCGVAQGVADHNLLVRVGQVDDRMGADISVRHLRLEPQRDRVWWQIREERPANGLT